MPTPAPTQPAFTISQFSDKNLFEALCNPHCTVDEIGKKDRPQYLFRYLQELGARTLLIESEYTDRDYLEDYAAYYARCFKEYHRWTKRLHFFTCELTQEQFLQAIRGESSPLCSLIERSYLGFVVARPLPDAVIGRTVVRPYPSDNGRRHYPATITYPVNLFGLELAVVSLAFQEQDTVLAACATVALWSSFHRTRELFGSLAPTPAEITRIANQVVQDARPIPSHGLAVQQMCNAIRQTGLEPEVFELNPGVPISSLIYAHLKMGFPVIFVAFPGPVAHAVTIAGYSIKAARHVNSEVGSNWSCIPMTGLRVDEFYAHDDQIGPFSRVRIEWNATAKPTESPLIFRGSWPQPFVPRLAIIPVYNKIRVNFIDIWQIVTLLDEIFRRIFKPDPPPPLEWEPYLIFANDLKKLLRSELTDRDQLQKFLFAHHPRFVWRVILKYSTIPIVEFHFDATDMARSFNLHSTVWHQEMVKNHLNSYMLQPGMRAVYAAIPDRLWDYLFQSTTN